MSDAMKQESATLQNQTVIQNHFISANQAPEGLHKCFVGDVAASSKNALVGGPFGSDLVSKDYVSSGVPVIRGQNMGLGRWVGGDFVFVSPKKADSLSSNLAHPNDLLFTQRGTLGQVALIPAKPFERYLISQSQMKLTADEKKAYPLFLYYLFSSAEQQAYIRKNAIQTGVPHTNLGILRNTPISLPPLPEQKRIAHILGTLDDKIELNRRMNATLEAMARALFQSWFVDFDPVRAKLDGRQPVGMDKATAALFPCSFQDSALGPIPKGWTADTIKNRASNIQYGFTQSATKEPVGPHFVRITDISGGMVDWASVPFCQATDDEREKYRIVDGDILIARTGASTGDNIYAVEPPPAVFASYLIRIQFLSRGLGRLVGEFTRTPDYASYVAGTIGGSAQPNASAQTLAAASMVFPTEEIADAFYQTVRPLDLMRASNDSQSRTLATLRDTLLPKLLSGDLKTTN